MPKAKQQEPKLKTSCNNCTSAKVGCKKHADASADTSKCVRCTQQNVECVYDVSQRKGKPFQPYPRNKPAEVARNVSHSQGQQDLDNNSNNGSKPDNAPQNVDHREKQQNSGNVNNGSSNGNSHSTTNKDTTYPWPITGWNLSDIYRKVDYSSVSQNPTDDSELTLPRKHDICSIMSNLRAHLLKLEKLLNNTYGSYIPKDVSDEYVIEFRTIRATIQQLLCCKCDICRDDTAQAFLLATLSLSLSESYRSIMMNLGMALSEVCEDADKITTLSTFAASLEPELVHFGEICHLIREKCTRHPDFKAVGEAYYEMLKIQGEGYLSLLDSWLGNAAAHWRRLQGPNPIRFEDL